MDINKMVESDIPELALLYRQFWNEDSSVEKMKAKFKKLDADPNYILLSARIDSKLVGSVMGIICEELYGDCRPFLVIENLIVDSTHRKKGIAKSLLLRLEKVAIEHQCTQIILVTEKVRQDAIDFYASLGFDPATHTGFKKSLKK